MSYYDKILSFILQNYIFIFKLIVILVIYALLRLHTVLLSFEINVYIRLYPKTAL